MTWGTSCLTSSPRLKPGDSRAHARGFLFHSRLRAGCPVPSDISSTGISTVSGAYGRRTVQEISPGGADLPVRAGHLRLRFPPVRGAFLAAGQPALIPGQGVRPAGQLPGISGLLPIRRHREGLDAQVHADDRACGRKLFQVVYVKAKETYQRPHGSRETVTVVGSRVAGPVSGQDHTN